MSETTKGVCPNCEQVVSGPCTGEGCPLTPTPPDAEAVARDALNESVIDLCGAEVFSACGEAYLVALDAYRAAVRADADAEVERLRELLEDFFDEDVEALRLHPDIPWGIGGKSGAERVAEWRKDLADRIERILAAREAK